MRQEEITGAVLRRLPLNVGAHARADEVSIYLDDVPLPQMRLVSIALGDRDLRIELQPCPTAAVLLDMHRTSRKVNLGLQVRGCAYRCVAMVDEYRECMAWGGGGSLTTVQVNVHMLSILERDEVRR